MDCQTLPLQSCILVITSLMRDCVEGGGDQKSIWNQHPHASFIITVITEWPGNGAPQGAFFHHLPPMSPTPRLC